MIEIKFVGTSMENVIRQIAAFMERTEEKGVKKNVKREKGKAAGSDQGDMG